MTIGVSGAKGSFSEEAALTYTRKAGIESSGLEYLVSVDAVLNALTNKKIDRGVFPIENSNGGIVIEAVHAMSKYVFSIKEMFEIDVRHCLLVKPEATSSSITTITSHDQALKQCRMYLKRKWGEVDLEEYRDTADAAKDLGSGVLPPTTAVIAPARCADMYGLEILEEGIQDLKFNFTTFLVVERT